MLNGATAGFWGLRALFKVNVMNTEQLGKAFIEHCKSESDQQFGLSFEVLDWYLDQRQYRYEGGGNYAGWLWCKSITDSIGVYVYYHAIDQDVRVHLAVSENGDDDKEIFIGDFSDPELVVLALNKAEEKAQKFANGELKVGEL